MQKQIDKNRFANLSDGNNNIILARDVIAIIGFGNGGEHYLSTLYCARIHEKETNEIPLNTLWLLGLMCKTKSAEGASV